MKIEFHLLVLQATRLLGSAFACVTLADKEPSQFGLIIDNYDYFAIFITSRWFTKKFRKLAACMCLPIGSNCYRSALEDIYLYQLDLRGSCLRGIFLIETLREAGT